MHEMSIAASMIELVHRYVPADARVLNVNVKAGPLRGIDPDTMEIAWRATTMDTEMEGSILHLEIPPWQLQCPQCQRQWESASLNTVCECGCDQPSFNGGDELLLMSIEVEDEDNEEANAEPQREATPTAR